MDNLWFGILIIATLGAAGWYSGTASTRPGQRFATFVLAALGVLTVAAFVANFIMAR